MADYKEQGVYQEGNSLFDDIFAFGDLEVQNINVVGIITAKTFSGVDATYPRCILTPNPLKISFAWYSCKLILIYL